MLEESTFSVALNDDAAIGTSTITFAGFCFSDVHELSKVPKDWLKKTTWPLMDNHQ